MSKLSPVPQGSRELRPFAGTFDESSSPDLLTAFDQCQAFIRDLDGTILFWCAGSERLYGWSRSEAEGRLSHVLLQTEFPDPVSEITAALIENGFWQGELSHLTKAGTRVRVASYWVLRKSNDPQNRSVIEVNNDITARERADQADRFLASIVESSDDAIVSKDMNGMVTSWNSGAEHLFGYSRSEMIGQPILKLFPPHLVDEEDLILSRIRAGLRIEHYETYRVSKSGTTIPVSLSISPLYDAKGKVAGAAKIARDISQRRALEEAVRAGEERQRLALEAGEVGIWSYDTRTRRTFWNPRCKVIFGLPPDALAPSFEAALKLIHADDAEQLNRLFMASVNEGVEFELDFRILSHSGPARWVQTKGRPRMNASGIVTEIHGTVVDLTPRKQMEHALRRTNDQLQQFAYAAAHDLQEPLRNISLSLGLTKKRLMPNIEAGVSDLLDSATQGAQRMHEMVRDLLAYSKISHTDGPWPLISAQEAAAIAVENLDATIRAASAQVMLDKLPAVRMQDIHLVQIFQNLIGNGLKYGGAAPPSIHIGAESCGPVCKLWVRDNGIGIPPEFQERVFGLFKRLHAKDVPGTGVGLALCKRIIEFYGGEIWFESDGKNGTSFFFTVPSAGMVDHVVSDEL